jgi:hypothetical protein
MRICLILVLAGLVACAGEPRKAHDFEAQRDAAVAELTKRGTAQSLATASLLSSFKNAAQSQALIKRAVDVAPEQPALAYLQWRECAAGPCAEEQQIRIRLQAVAPDNGLSWLPDLNAAWESADAFAVTLAVARIGASRHISIYWNALVVMMTDALGEGSPSPTGAAIFPDLTTRMVYAVGILSAVSIPPLLYMGKSCRLDQFDQPGRREACEAMTARLSESDNVLMQGLAISIQQKWWPEGSVEREQLHAQRRQLDYVLEASTRTRVLHMRRDSAERLKSLRNSNREVEAMQAMLVIYHRPPQRPTNWKGRPRGRNDAMRRLPTLRWE